MVGNVQIYNYNSLLLEFTLCFDKKECFDKNKGALEELHVKGRKDNFLEIYILINLLFLSSATTKENLLIMTGTVQPCKIGTWQAISRQ